MAEGNLWFKYKFIFEDGTRRQFQLDVDRNTLNFINILPEPYPAWTRLDNHKCPHCSLDERLSPYCPSALAMVLPVSVFSDSISYEKSDVFIETEDRKYMKSTTLQEGLSAMMGLCMATSGCPVTEALKPMVRFHLPFATEMETMYRVLSMYLLAQYIVYKKDGGKPDWDMANLHKIYDRIRTMNHHFTNRLRTISMKDASLNAIVNLNCFAISVKFSIDLAMTEDMENLFAAYR